MPYVDGEVHIVGGDPARVRAAMFATDPVMKREMRRANDVLASITADEWRRLAPVKTGEYRAGIRIETMDTPEGVVSRVFNDVDHAAFVERGTGIYGPRRAMIRVSGTEEFTYGPGLKGRRGRFMYWNAGVGGRRFGPGQLIRKRFILGQRAQWVAKRAARETRVFVDPTLRTFARNAKRIIKDIGGMHGGTV